MGREIICNNVNLLALGKASHDLFKEGHKLCTGVTRRGLAHRGRVVQCSLLGENRQALNARTAAKMVVSFLHNDDGAPSRTGVNPQAQAGAIHPGAVILQPSPPLI
jgi:hypothetical protein